MTNYLVLTLLVLTNFAFGKKNFVTGTIGFSSGEELECEFILSIKNSRDGTLNKDHKRLRYRINEGAKTLSVDFDDLAFISVNTEKGKILLRRMHYYKLRAKKEPKKNKRKVWLQYRHGCEELQGYLLIYEFAVDRHGTIIEKYVDGMGGYLLMRKEEEIPTLIGYVFLRKIVTQASFDKQRRKALDKYFADYEEGKAFLENKKRISQQSLKEFILNQCDNE